MNYQDYQDTLKKLDASIGYLRTIEEYRQSNDIVEDFDYIFSSFCIISDNWDAISSEDYEANLTRDIDTEYWTLKYMANTINYINAMKPICARFNPTDEDKARFVEFIKNLEDQ